MVLDQLLFLIFSYLAPEDTSVINVCHHWRTVVQEGTGSADERITCLWRAFLKHLVSLEKPIRPACVDGWVTHAIPRMDRSSTEASLASPEGDRGVPSPAIEAPIDGLEVGPVTLFGSAISFEETLSRTESWEPLLAYFAEVPDEALYEHVLPYVMQHMPTWGRDYAAVVDLALALIYLYRQAKNRSISLPATVEECTRLRTLRGGPVLQNAREPHASDSICHSLCRLSALLPEAASYPGGICAYIQQLFASHRLYSEWATWRSTIMKPMRQAFWDRDAHCTACCELMLSKRAIRQWHTEEALRDRDWRSVLLYRGNKWSSDQIRDELGPAIEKTFDVMIGEDPVDMHAVIDYLDLWEVSYTRQCTSKLIQQGLLAPFLAALNAPDINAFSYNWRIREVIETCPEADFPVVIESALRRCPQEATGYTSPFMQDVENPLCVVIQAMLRRQVSPEIQQRMTHALMEHGKRYLTDNQDILDWYFGLALSLRCQPGAFYDYVSTKFPELSGRLMVYLVEHYPTWLPHNSESIEAVIKLALEQFPHYHLSSLEAAVRSLCERFPQLDLEKVRTFYIRRIDDLVSKQLMPDWVLYACFPCNRLSDATELMHLINKHSTLSTEEKQSLIERRLVSYIGSFALGSHRLKEVVDRACGQQVGIPKLPDLKALPTCAELSQFFATADQVLAGWRSGSRLSAYMVERLVIRGVYHVDEVTPQPFTALDELEALGYLLLLKEAPEQWEARLTSWLLPKSTNPAVAFSRLFRFASRFHALYTVSWFQSSSHGSSSQTRDEYLAKHQEFQRLYVHFAKLMCAQWDLLDTDQRSQAELAADDCEAIITHFPKENLDQFLSLGLYACEKGDTTGLAQAIDRAYGEPGRLVEALLALLEGNAPLPIQRTVLMLLDGISPTRVGAKARTAYLSRLVDGLMPRLSRETLSVQRTCIKQIRERFFFTQSPWLYVMLSLRLFSLWVRALFQSST